uniref:Uncharacterized protein n=1 Tax=Attheya septentrionalis TaxID=420275 RepID=A0A7S2XS39_9STRA|mmetsp:Transcript_441/g.740  ORF Transcript_441/g.740 Transcript_441/m.740 type:complete len:200 (+) Transcript_441:153-752(+)
MRGAWWFKTFLLVLWTASGKASSPFTFAEEESLFFEAQGNNASSSVQVLHDNYSWGECVCPPNENMWQIIRKHTFKPLQRSYQRLPPNGKLAVSGITGLISSRMVVKTAVIGVKLLGATLMAAEVLNCAGVLKELDDETTPTMDEAFGQFKKMATNAANFVKLQIQERFRPEAIRSTLEAASQHTTMGFATGAFIGFVV